MLNPPKIEVLLYPVRICICHCSLPLDDCLHFFPQPSFYFFFSQQTIIPIIIVTCLTLYQHCSSNINNYRLEMTTFYKPLNMNVTSWRWFKHTSWVHLLMVLSTSLSFLYAWCWSAWFSNIWILLDWIWVWTLTRSCICFMAFAVCFFTLLLLTTPWSLTKPLKALKLLLACQKQKTLRLECNVY